MENQEKNIREYYTVDLLHIFKTLWRRIWIVILSGIIAAGIGFSYSSFVVTPMYSSSVMLYVNNSSFSLGSSNFTISSSQIVAAQSLVNTYTEILNNRTTLERVIDKAGVSYTYGQLSGMISASSSNETEIMKVTVTADDPYVAANLANCIAEVLPVRISEIIDGASMEVVDSAIPNLQKVSPNITKYTAIGLMLGVLISAIAVVIAAMMDNTIHDEEYVLNTYNYPVLAKVPNLLDVGSKQYGYQYQQKQKPKN